jgi:hypothetical protein
MMLLSSAARLSGKIPVKIFSPSRGKIGTRLNIASETFIMIRIDKTAEMIELSGKNFMIRERINAKARLEIGPIKAMSAESRLGLRML